jgi:hypothetical protein
LMASTKDIEMADARRPDKDKEGHNLGWPHYDRKGNCICLCWRCFGSWGCICKGCTGHNHANCQAGHACGPATCKISAPPSLREPYATLAALPEPTTAELYATHSVESYLGLSFRKGA